MERCGSDVAKKRKEKKNKKENRFSFCWHVGGGDLGRAEGGGGERERRGRGGAGTVQTNVNFHFLSYWPSRKVNFYSVEQILFPTRRNVLRLCKWPSRTLIIGIDQYCDFNFYLQSIDQYYEFRCIFGLFMLLQIFCQNSLVSLLSIATFRWSVLQFCRWSVLRFCRWSVLRLLVA